MGKTISFEDFLKVEIRVGRIVKIEDFPEAKKSAYKLTIDSASSASKNPVLK